MSKKEKEIIATTRKENRTFLLDPESKQLMKEISITTTDFQVAKNSKEAIKMQIILTLEQF